MDQVQRHPECATGFRLQPVGSKDFDHQNWNLGKLEIAGLRGRPSTCLPKGHDDTEEKLRISIITGINNDNPAKYRVVIGTNPKLLMHGKATHVIMVSRFLRMTPENSTNLERFLESYNEKQKYLLIPGIFGKHGCEAWASKLGILKRELFVRPAWQIGEHDPDVSGIDEDDKIIIPDDVKDPPVMRALARKKMRKSKVDFFPAAKLPSNKKTQGVAP